MSVIFNVNRQTRQYHGDPMTALVDVLRRDLGLTGTKAVCREGFCGACTVHVEGVPMLSCLKPVGLAEGCDITTIEGWGIVGVLQSPVQRALLAADAVQCGMCFPGMVMVLSGFLADHPGVGRDEIRGALSGNICRCTGYERIVEAALACLAQGGSADD
jgi:carbon-monoxide dehydrogenase small subunit